MKKNIHPLSRRRGIALPLAFAGACLAASSMPLTAQTRPAWQPPAAGVQQAGPRPIRLNEAVSLAVKNSPKLIQETVTLELAKADSLEAAAPFDTTVSASMAYDAIRGYKYPADLQAFSNDPGVKKIDFLTDRINNTELKAGLTQLFRNGVYADFSVALQSSDDARKQQDIAWNVLPNMAALGIPASAAASSLYSPFYPSRVQLLINVPLLKMRGPDNLPAANERSKQWLQAAAESTLKQALATIIQDVVNRYWAYKASDAIVRFQFESQRNIQGWLQTVERQAAPDSKEVAHLRGYLTQRNSDIVKAREIRAQARAALAVVMGISADDARQVIGDAVDEYPMDWTEVAETYDHDALMRRWQKLAEQNRGDLKAASLKRDAANALLAGALNDARPKLDFTLILKEQGFAVGGSGMSARAASLRDGTSDLGYTAMLSFAYPLGNDRARALVARTTLGKRQADVLYHDAQRTIGITVEAAATAVESSLNVLQSARRQTEFAVQALDALIKPGVTPATVFDLVVLETARMTAATSHVAALLAVSTALTQAHFQAGTLLRDSSGGQEIVLSDLTRLP